MSFTLIPREGWTSAEGWAADRGAIVRESFGLVVDDLRPQGMVKPSAYDDIGWNAAKVATLHPAFRDRFVAFLDAVEQESAPRGVDFIVWDAVRTLERQVALYRRGRTDKGPKVTYTIASAQGHLFGLAIDLCVRSSTGQPVFDLPTWYHERILPLAATCGLESLLLARGLDPPHVQVPLADVPEDVRLAARALKRDFPGLEPR